MFFGFLFVHASQHLRKETLDNIVQLYQTYREEIERDRMKEIKYKKDEEKELIVFSILGGDEAKNNQISFF